MKKKLLGLFFVILILSGCSTMNLKQIEKFESIVVFDFTEYAEKGFLFTTNPYNGKFKSIGIVDCIVRARAKKEKFIVNEFTKEVWIVEKLEPKEILDLVYDKAIEMGGDAIMNLEIKPNGQTHQVSSYGETYTVPGIEIYGFIIKRI